MFAAYDKHKPYSLLGRCDRCLETFKCDARTLRKTLKAFKGEAQKVTRKRLIEELQTRPLYPVSRFEDLNPIDMSDKPVLKVFDHGAALTNEGTYAGKITAIRVSGRFKHLEKKPPREIKIVKTGAIRGKRTRPLSKN